MRLNITVVLLFTFTLLFSQKIADKKISDLEIRYDYSFIRDTTDIDRSHRINEVMILDFNSNSSIYFSEGFMNRRKAIENVINVAKNSTISPEIKIADLPKSSIGYSVYREDSRIYVTSNLYRDFYTFETSFLKWNTNFSEKKKILGYDCHKATVIFNNRLFTAWYTKDIPISEGPYRFKGLPGVILQIADMKEYHTFNAISIEKKQKEIIQLRKGIPVQREQYIQKREEFKNNPYPGRVIDKAKREQMINASKKSNNPLET